MNQQFHSGKSQVEPLSCCTGAICGTVRIARSSERADLAEFGIHDIVVVPDVPNDIQVLSPCDDCACPCKAPAGGWRIDHTADADAAVPRISALC